MYYKTEYGSPIGILTIASDGESIIGLWVEGQKYFAGSIKKELHINDNLPIFDLVKSWLDRYFAGDRTEISELPLAPQGSEFRQEVWKILQKIPYGETMTYGEIAKKIAQKNGRQTMSAQAVGGAVGHNPISIIIPCHRVVGTNKSLTGFAGGIHKKVWLLEHEGIDIKKFTIPTRKKEI